MKLNLSLSNLITKAARVVSHHYQRELLPFGISPSQGGIVYILSIVGTSTQVEIAKLLHLEKTNVNAMVKKLITKGFLKIEKDTGDARKSRVALTAKGADLAVKLTEIDRQVGLIYREMTGSSENAEIIRKFLEKIVFDE